MKMKKKKKRRKYGAKQKGNNCHYKRKEVFVASFNQTQKRSAESWVLSAECWKKKEEKRKGISKALSDLTMEEGLNHEQGQGFNPSTDISNLLHSPPSWVLP